LLMLDRSDRAGDIAASVLLAVSIASSSLGIAVAVGLAVEVLWGRRRWRDAWIVAAPLVLYALWWVPYHDVNAFTRHNIVVSPAATSTWERSSSSCWRSRWRAESHSSGAPPS